MIGSVRTNDLVYITTLCWKGDSKDDILSKTITHLLRGLLDLLDPTPCVKTQN